ncbi:GRIP and coiled-coil [Sparganum proliferum]
MRLSKQVVQPLDSPKSLNDEVSGSTEFAEQIRLLRSQNVSLLSELEAIKSSVRSRLAAASEEAKLRLAETVTRYEGHIAKLEVEARRYRDQTLNLLAEKEDEISGLRTALFLANKGEEPQMVRSSQFSSPNLNHILSEEDNARGDGQVLPDSTQNGEQVSHCGLLHCAEQYGRLSVELKRLRKAKYDLEQRLVVLEAEHREEKQALMDTLRERHLIETPSAHDNSSLAYVKNVIFNLLVGPASSLSSRQAMLKALVMALNYSKDEESAIMQSFSH